MAGNPIPLGAQTPGIGIDAFGGKTVDPTKNVLDLVAAAKDRSDDLRHSDRRYIESEVTHIKEMAALRAEYTKMLSEAEAKRIDAIRAVDVNAVAVASERQTAAASVLANQVAQSADALRTLVATTATAAAEQQRQALTQITDRLSVVERSQYEGRGKSAFVDPQVMEMIAEMKRVSAQIASGSGREAATKDYTAWIFAGIGTLLGVAGFVAALFR